jgi:hypothetical protein
MSMLVLCVGTRMPTSLCLLGKFRLDYFIRWPGPGEGGGGGTVCEKEHCVLSVTRHL